MDQSAAPGTTTTLKMLTPCVMYGNQEKDWSARHTPCLVDWLDEHFPESDENFQMALYRPDGKRWQPHART